MAEGAGTEVIGEGRGDQPSAEPISPATLGRYPHLAPFQGHLLLGAGELQVIVAGIPTKPDGQLWQAGLLAVFVTKEGRWTRQDSVTSVALGNRAVNNTVFSATAVDVGSDGNSAYATLIYAAGNGSKQIVTWRLAGGTLPSLSVSFEDPGRGPADIAARWQLKVCGKGGPTLGTQHPGAAGVPMLTRSAGEDVAVLLGYRSLNVSTAGPSCDEVVAAVAKDGQRPPLEGFEFLLTARGAAQALARAATLDECLYGVERPRKGIKEEAKIGWLAACSPSINLAVLHAKTLPDAFAPLYLFDAESGRALLYVPVKGQADIALLPGHAYQLADTPFGRMIAPGEVIKLQAGEQKDVTLSVPAPGYLRVGAGGGSALVMLRPMNQQNAGLTPKIVGNNTREIAAGLWLAKTWPAEWEVPSGGYEILAASGQGGVFCHLRARVLAGRRSVLTCPEKPSEKFTSAGFADLGMTPPDEGPDADLAEALGVQAMVAPAANPHAVKTPLVLVAMLSVFDPLAGVNLSFFPARPPLVERWQKLAKQPGDIVERFTTFLATEAASGVLELGCPGPGTSLVDYEALARRVKAQAVRLFGCPELTAETLSSWYGALAALPVPPVLTAQSMVGEFDRRPFFPRLAWTGKVADDQGLVQEIRRGNYSISAGGTVEIVKVEIVRPAGKGKWMSASAKVAFTVAPGVTPVELAFYTEKGEIKRMPLAPGANGQIDLSPLDLGGAAWLRAELYGTSEWTGRSRALVAATSFVRALRSGDSH